MSPDQLKVLFPRASKAFLDANTSTPEAPQRPHRRDLKSITLANHANPHHHDQIPHARLKRNHAPALVSPASGEEKGVGRAIVRFVGYRMRLLDVDSFPASIKGILDGLCKIGLVQSDQSKHIVLETDQVKVACAAEERLVVTITYP